MVRLAKDGSHKREMCSSEGTGTDWRDVLDDFERSKARSLEKKFFRTSKEAEERQASFVALHEATRALTPFTKSSTSGLETLKKLENASGPGRPESLDKVSKKS